MSERLPRIIIDENCDYMDFTHDTLKSISSITSESIFFKDYPNFLNYVQIPFESLCINILQELKQKFIHINIVKNVVKSSFEIFVSEEDDKNNQGSIIYADFKSWTGDLHNPYYSLHFIIILSSESISYKCSLFQDDLDGKSTLWKNCHNLPEKILNRLNQKLVSEYFAIHYTNSNEYHRMKMISQLIDIPEEHAYSIVSNKIIDISSLIDANLDEVLTINNDFKKTIFAGFKDFLVLSLLAIQENPIDEIEYILNYEEKQQDSMIQLIEDTNLEEKELTQYIKTLKRKKHIIFQGSPGTGKTYLAKHIAKHLSSERNGFYELIQFHPSYSYEDFIQGIRPQTSTDGNLEYSMIPGRFLTFCEKAKDCEGMCILIIDEINRTNLSQVFGELMYLLEYREEEIQLSGSDQKFKIPENVYIIGTMNTADRSIALVDHALRRRFAFIPIKPNYDILRKYHQKHNPNYDIESLINILIELNKTINDRHYEIGVSFFLTETLPDDLEDIWTMEIEPYLEEYFFDETDKIQEFRWTKIKDKLNF